MVAGVRGPVAGVLVPPRGLGEIDELTREQAVESLRPGLVDPDEIDPRYAQVTIDRWETFTGRTAERLGG